MPASAETYVSNCSRREPSSSLTIRPRLSVVQGSACTVVKSDGKDVADMTENVRTTAADVTKDADDNAAIEATAIGDGIASGVTAAVSSASFATGASAVFGAAMVLMA